MFILIVFNFDVISPPRRRLRERPLAMRITFHSTVPFFVFMCLWCGAHFRLGSERDSFQTTGFRKCTYILLFSENIFH